MNKRNVLTAICVLLLALMICGCSESGQSEQGDETTAGSGSNSSTVLTITGFNEGSKDYTVKDLEAIGGKTYSYSGRNKENNNQRQVREYSGIELKTLLKDAGYGADGEVIKVSCSDGYTREYEVDSLYDLYFFDGDKAEKGEKVPPMLAIVAVGESIGNDKTYSEKDGSPLRLVYGQADYDSEYTKDFNMQGWASYVEKIEVKKANE